jgi:large subunit ribosomal protein L15
VNVGRIQQAIDAGKLDPNATIDAAALVAAGVLRRAHDGVRLLGVGGLKAKIAVEVAYASAGARSAVEKAGGAVTATELREPAAAPNKESAKPPAKAGPKKAGKE